MIYNVLRWIAGICLHWFYHDITISGLERIPRSGPVIVAANHHNALVDSLIAGWVIPRRLAMTAKATLAENWLIALLFKLLNVVPLRRASDEDSTPFPLDRNRNRTAFVEIIDLLSRNGVVLIFPEGKSHSEGGVEPLKSGLARMALEAREKGVASLKILPVGLVFDDKGTPGSTVAVNFAEPVEIDAWQGNDAKALTEVVATKLREVAAPQGVPPRGYTSAREGAAANPFVKLVAWWGRTTHDIPIRCARALAVRKSTSPDEPAMLTIIFGIALVLLTYAVHITIISLIMHSVVVTGVYLVTLVTGAYCAAFEPRPYPPG